MEHGNGVTGSAGKTLGVGMREIAHSLDDGKDPLARGLRDIRPVVQDPETVDTDTRDARAMSSMEWSSEWLLDRCGNALFATSTPSSSRVPLRPGPRFFGL